jgi:hypothetical protein
VEANCAEICVFFARLKDGRDERSEQSDQVSTRRFRSGYHSSRCSNCCAHSNTGKSFKSEYDASYHHVFTSMFSDPQVAPTSGSGTTPPQSQPCNRDTVEPFYFSVGSTAVDYAYVLSNYSQAVQILQDQVIQILFCVRIIILCCQPVMKYVEKLHYFANVL